MVKRLVAHCVLALLMLVLFVGRPAADVVVKGKVEYWDRLQNKYLPAMGVHVEVEGDWWWFSDPDVLTNDNGNYSATVGNPPWWWNNYDGVDIEVYAETGGVVQVFESMWSWWPYHAISKEIDNVKSNQTVVFDLKIGGPQNNIGEAYYRNAEETANAFMAHQRALDQYRRLRGWGFPQSDFDEVEIIVPAATPTGVSYYNHLTGFVNLAIASAGLTGTGPWINIPTGNSANGAIENFRDLVQHEYGHAIHDEMTGWIAPLGLSMPAYHSPYTESNRFLAFTEGFAEFLPLAVGNVTYNIFESSRTVPGFPPALSLPAGGDHYAMEGEVGGVLWDVFDAVGPEPFRNPALKSADGAYPVPAKLVEAQRWQDRIQDGNLAKTRVVMQEYVPLWPVQTIGEYLDEYKSRYPAELHALKSIAYNRGITVSMPAENPATLSGSPSVSRFGSRLDFKLQINEPDAEDRPYVSASVWLESAGGVVAQLGQLPESASGWSGADRQASFSANLPGNYASPAVLWVIVSDDMLPCAYRADLPPNSAVMQIAKPDFSVIMQVMNPKLLVATADFDSNRVALPDNPNKVIARLPENADAQKFKRTRELFNEAKGELRAYAERKKRMLRQEAGLYKLARTLGDLQTSSEAEALFQARPARAERVRRTDENNPDVRAYRQWTQRKLRGEPISREMAREDQAVFNDYLARLDQLVQEQRTAGSRIADLRSRLSSACSETPLGEQAVNLRLTTDQALASCQQNLTVVASDQELLQKLDTQERVIKLVAGGQATGVTGKLEVKPLEGVVLQPAAAADITGIWDSNIGLRYEITQVGGQYQWRDPSGIVGSITVSASGLAAAWSDAAGAHTANGTIATKDAAGRATRIAWDNGVVFYRDTAAVQKQPLQQAGAPVDIAGDWSSNIGLTYRITQQGGQFEWQVSGLADKGTGTVSGSEVTVTWTDAAGQHSAKGAAGQPDATGKPTVISFDNGVELRRIGVGQPGQVQQPAVTEQQGGGISGTWNSNIRLVFEITQSGSNFTWLVRSINQQASGEVNGDNITASWMGTAGKESATGRIVRDATGRAVRIEWSNGVVFTR